MRNTNPLLIAFMILCLPNILMFILGYLVAKYGSPFRLSERWRSAFNRQPSAQPIVINRTQAAKPQTPPAPEAQAGD